MAAGLDLAQHAFATAGTDQNSTAGTQLLAARCTAAEQWQIKVGGSQ